MKEKEFMDQKAADMTIKELAEAIKIKNKEKGKVFETEHNKITVRDSLLTVEKKGGPCIFFSPSDIPSLDEALSFWKEGKKSKKSEKVQEEKFPKKFHIDEGAFVFEVDKGGILTIRWDVDSGMK